jgi:hypothetical protein
MGDYEARLRNILKGSSGSYGSSFGRVSPSFSLPTINSISYLTADSGSTFGTIFKGILFFLLLLFIILAILIAVHYTITPIFNFGDNPLAIIPVGNNSGWQSFWPGPKTTSDLSAPGLNIPAYNYSFTIDAQILKDTGSTLNRPFIIFYRGTKDHSEATTQAGLDINELNANITSNTNTVNTEIAKLKSYIAANSVTSAVIDQVNTYIGLYPIDSASMKTAAAPSRASSVTGINATSINTSLTTLYTARNTIFDAYTRIRSESQTFASNSGLTFGLKNGSTVPTYPLIVAYDPLQGKIVVYIKTSTDGITEHLLTVSADAIPQNVYRIGVVVGNTLIELYINGQWINTTVFGANGTPVADPTDAFFNNPSTDSAFVQSRNLYIVNRVVSSGAMQVQGGPASWEDFKYF